MKTRSQTDPDLDIKPKYNKLKCLAVRWYLYATSNTHVTFEAEFIKKLSNTDAELKKDVAYKKRV